MLGSVWNEHVVEGGKEEEEEGHSLGKVGDGSSHQVDCVQRKSGEWDAVL